VTKDSYSLWYTTFSGHELPIYATKLIPGRSLETKVELIGPNMNQPLLVSGVDFIPILIIEESCDILECLPDRAPDGRSARISSPARADLECWIARAYLGNALPCEYIAHVDGAHS